MLPKVDRRGRATAGEPGQTRRTSTGTAAGTSQLQSRPWTVRPTVPRWASAPLTQSPAVPRESSRGGQGPCGWLCHFLQRVVVASSFIGNSNVFVTKTHPCSFLSHYSETANISGVHTSHCPSCFFLCLCPLLQQCFEPYTFEFSFYFGNWHLMGEITFPARDLDYLLWLLPCDLSSLTVLYSKSVCGLILTFMLVWFGLVVGWVFVFFFWGFFLFLCFLNLLKKRL